MTIHLSRLTTLVTCTVATLAASPVLANSIAPSRLQQETVASGSLVGGDNDVDVDTADLTTGFQNFTGSQASSLASVPEPSTMVLMGLGLLGLVFWGLRRKR